MTCRRYEEDKFEIVDRKKVCYIKTYFYINYHVLSLHHYTIYAYTKEYLKSLKNNQAKVSSDILPTEIIVILVVL